MPLHPDAQASIDARTAAGAVATESLSPDAARAQLLRLASLSGPPEPVAKIVNGEFPGAAGPLTMRIYYPSLEPGLPVLHYVHGGGFVQGNLDTADNLCRTFTNLSGCIVVSTNYRHAPESKFPAAPEDAYAAAVWVAENAAAIGGDPTRIAISGTSAGGNLAAAATLMARAAGKPKIQFQVLIVPVTDAAMDTQSYRDYAEGYVLTRAVMEWSWNYYLADPADSKNPYASPLHASDFSNLPPAFIATAEYDGLRDEGHAYAEKLAAAGVPVEYHNYPGMIHGYIGPQAYRDAMRALRTAFGMPNS